MGLKTYGFGGGREDVWEPEDATSTGARRPNGSGTSATPGTRQTWRNPLGAVQMGLIYVNPEGPNGEPDPLAAAKRHSRDLRPDGDERRGDRGAHRRRSHLRQNPWRQPIPTNLCGPQNPSGAARSNRALAGPEQLRDRHAGNDTITSGLEGAWTTRTGTAWDNNFFENLFGYEWELTKESGRRPTVDPEDPAATDDCPRCARLIQAPPRPDDGSRPTLPCVQTRSTSPSRAVSTRTPRHSRRPLHRPGSS